MSGNGTPELAEAEISALRDFTSQHNPQLAIIASRWHERIMNGLIDGARDFNDLAGVTDATVIRAPGSFELPLIAQQVSADVDIVVALGVVIRGGTPHFEYVCQAATDGLLQVSLATGTPIGFGVLTCDTEDQALARAGLEGSVENKGYEAAHAALSTAAVLEGFKAGR